MTDKIIIDGVDVSGCEYLDTQFKHKGYIRCEILEMSCHSSPNCYYKQLVCKTEECDTLKSQFDFEIQQKECLEQELEKLKEQLIKNDEANMFFSTPVEGWSDNPCKICRYKQALEQIRQELEESIHCESQECGCDDAAECLEYTKKLILQKCKVLEDK